MKPLVLLAAFAFAATAAAQTPAPAQDTAQKRRPPLKLKLDEVDPPSRSTVTFGKPDDRKPDPANSLPGLGGSMSNAWERPSSKIFPPDTETPKPP